MIPKVEISKLRDFGVFSVPKNYKYQFPAGYLFNFTLSYGIIIIRRNKADGLEYESFIHMGIGNVKGSGVYPMGLKNPQTELRSVS